MQSKMYMFAMKPMIICNDYFMTKIGTSGRQGSRQRTLFTEMENKIIKSSFIRKSMIKI